MPKKKDVNFEKLIKAVDSGRSSREIMEEFGIKSSAQLKTAYLDALVATGRVKGVVGSPRGRRKAEKSSNEIVVNKRGSLVLSRSMVEELGFAEGEAFSVRRTKSGVSLKKV